MMDLRYCRRLRASLNMLRYLASSMFLPALSSKSLNPYSFSKMQSCKLLGTRSAQDFKTHSRSLIKFNIEIVDAVIGVLDHCTLYTSAGSISNSLHNLRALL
eukprot:NODE_391_length_9459_cov_0.222970.p6 type:complete len:102 gc:universal NODE_391_length_9459_cov_0.222970:4412-4107(-)